jgi:hypothetical protein
VRAGIPHERWMAPSQTAKRTETLGRSSRAERYETGGEAKELCRGTTTRKNEPEQNDPGTVGQVRARRSTETGRRRSPQGSQHAAGRPTYKTSSRPNPKRGTIGSRPGCDLPLRIFEIYDGSYEERRVG